MSVFVNVSGTAFSLLVYENIRNDYDQEGFLLGEIVTNEKRTITDNDQEVVTIEHTIKINSVLPCPRLGHFYNNAGKIDPIKIEAFLHGKKDCVVSWYKFKRTSSFKLTLREKIVMKQLANHFMPTSPERFSCCLLTHQMGSELGATHIFSQTFIRYYKSAYQPLPMHITNLKDPHDVYKNPEMCSPLFENIVKGLKLKKGAHGYASIDSIETALDKQISQTVEKLEQSEDEMHKLEMRITELRKKMNAVESESLDDLLGEDANANSEPPSKVKRNLRSRNIADNNAGESSEAVQEKRVLRNAAPRDI